MDELKKVADSIKSEEALKASPEDPALKEAIEDCKKPCTKDSIEQHTCAKVDVCCTAYGNSECIRTLGQPSFSEQQTGVRHFLRVASCDVALESLGAHKSLCS